MSEDLPENIRKLQIRLRNDREKAYKNNIAKLQEQKSNKRQSKNETILQNNLKSNQQNLNAVDTDALKPIDVL